MPYKSDAQRRFFHSEGAKEAGISSKVVKEFDKATKGKDIPEKVKAARGGCMCKDGKTCMACKDAFAKALKK